MKHTRLISGTLIVVAITKARKLPRTMKAPRGSGFSRDEPPPACELASRLKPLPPDPSLTQ